MIRVLFLCLIVLSFGCKKDVVSKTETTSFLESKSNNKVLSPELENQVVKFIEETSKKNKYVYHVYFYKVEGYSDCFLLLSTSFTYHPEMKGYTFVDKKLVVFYSESDMCFNQLVNIENMTLFNDSIGNYSDITKVPLMDAEYEERVFRVVDNDSLQIIDGRTFFE